jgi:hypothetical protein
MLNEKRGTHDRVELGARELVLLVPEVEVERADRGGDALDELIPRLGPVHVRRRHVPVRRCPPPSICRDSRRAHARTAHGVGALAPEQLRERGGHGPPREHRLQE